MTMQIKLSSHSIWSQNGTTVAGSPDAIPGSLSFQLNKPIGILITDNDILYVADGNNSRIVLVHLHSSMNTSTIDSIRASDLGQFRDPTDVFIFNSSLYVLDRGNRRIEKMPLNGSKSTITRNLTGLKDPLYFYIDNHGDIYVSDRAIHSVFVFRSSSSESLRVAGNGTRGSANEQLARPHGIFVTDVGTIYIADRENHRVMKWTSGASVGIRVAGDGTAGNSLTQVKSPTDVIVDENELLYISELGNSRITRWKPGSISGVCIVACSATAGNKPTQLREPHSLAFDSFGSLYVSEWANNRVQQFQILNYPVSFNQPKFLSNTTWSKCGVTFVDNKTLTSKVRGIFVDLNDTLYVADHMKNRILIWSNQSVDQLRQLNASLYEFTPLFVTLNGDIYFENGEKTGEIRKFTSSSTESKLITRLSAHCFGLFVDIRNTLYCSRHENHLVVKVLLTSDNHTERYIAGTGKAGSGSYELDQPMGIFVDLNYHLYVADGGNNRVQLFRRGDLNGDTVAGSNIPEGLTLQYPTGVTGDGNGFLYIADSLQHCIVRVGNGEFEYIAGCNTNTSGSSSNQLYHPHTVYFDSVGNLYVADEWNFRVQIFRSKMNTCDQLRTTEKPYLTSSLSKYRDNSTSMFIVVDSCGTTTNIGQNCNISGTVCAMQKPCPNNSNCIDLNNGHDYNCSCHIDFFDKQCQFSRSPCKLNTCLYGTCRPITNSTYDCTCSYGYEGTRCERKINYCWNITCYNRGVCRPLLGAYKCECLFGTGGEHCEKITTKLYIYRVVATSFAFIAILAMISVILFVIIMDFLRYFFGIDPVRRERERIRKERRAKRRKPVIQRFVYVNAKPPPKRTLSTIEEETSI
ncbi:unnamed protein product [Adineta ricciae]|uniref:EGF-like domain-containing protein n=1 Tax=Adineta ricciae TaxID=249248 RepID=A0A814U997_ADIRI|nr:unnamed protein product [Adineta ricciae]CAF1385614.1 unnamed protein product [Adineta ricciae]